MSKPFTVDRLIKFAPAIGLILIAVIFFSGLGDSTDSAEQQLENRLCDMICSMEEMDSVRPHVMVRLGKDGYTVIGAAVVCEKSDNPVIREKLLQLVSRALDIPISKISISV